ncbi:DNA polymerase I [Risungbinella massiliensis]|uniref:DNA polymerase I n=1 Tax=Risungbinella massiliensis TaxID=1329796 RepID=UPI0005CC65A2|nr:DNA polymerase I [Risungbinella massiliensis]
MSKLLLIDGNSIAFRAFFALPLLSNSSGIHTNAVYGFTMMLLKVLEDQKPTHALVAFDAGKVTFRHDDFSEYKGKRERTPSELSEQFPYIREVLDAFGIQHTQKENYEADDIIGTLAKQAAKEGIETEIISGDKDLLQLVNKTVHVLLTRKGITEMDHYDLAKLQEVYGLTPEQIPDLKGFMGDTSDNIPGIPGVGEKTALKLLHQFGTMEETLKRKDEISGKKLKEKVAEYEEQAKLSKKLATIFTEVPISSDLEELEIGDLPYERIIELFRKFEFKTLVDRVQKLATAKGDSVITKTKEQEIAVTVITESNSTLLDELLAKPLLGMEIESTKENPHLADIIGLALSDGEEGYFLDWEFAKENPTFRNWLASDTHEKVVFDIKRNAVLIERAGFKVQGLPFDTLLGAYLLNPSETQLELSDLVTRYLDGGLSSDEEVYGKGAKRKALSAERLAEHLSKKAYFQMKLREKLQEELIKYDLSNLLTDLEIPLTWVLAKMELLGVKVDRERLEEMGVELDQGLRQLTKEIYKLAGTEFNINSPKQLGQILFDKLNLPVIKKTKTGYSTSADVLEKLAPQHEIVEQILVYRQIGKLYSTYVEGLKKEIADDGKIHTRFNQTIAATGRLSSTEPNLQNIPIRLEEGRKIRQIFTPSNPDWKMLAADYSQVELRVLAHISGDGILQEAFRKEQDIHTRTAMDVFGVPEEEVTSLMRRQAKAVNFGIVYGISAFGLSQNLNITNKEAKDFIDRYFATFPGVKKYMESIVDQARQDGYVTTLLNRRRYLPDVHSSDFNRRSFAERTAMNTPIQGSAADIIKYAMVQIDLEMSKRNLQSRMLLQVHDELIFEVPPDELPEMKQLVREQMEQSLELRVPLKVDINVGDTWYEAK